MDSEAVHNKSEAAKPEEVKQHDMWWCVSARHCTSCDDTQGLMYANIPALAMFCRFVSMLGLWLTSTKNNNKCFSRHLFGWEVAKKKNLISYLILAKCLPSASRKQTFFFIWLFTEFWPRKTDFYILTAWSFHCWFIILILASGTTTTFCSYMFHQPERGTTQNRF